MASFCTSCGAPNEENRFCTNCGAPAAGPVTTQEGDTGAQTPVLPDSPTTPGFARQVPLYGTSPSTLGTPPPPVIGSRHRWPSRLFVIVVIVIAVVLVGAGLGAFFALHHEASSGAATPTSAVTGLLGEFKSGNYVAAENYIDPANRPSGSGSELLSFLDELPFAAFLAESATVSGHETEGTHAWVYVSDGLGTATVPCEEVGGTWFVYVGSTSWVANPPTSTPTTVSTSTLGTQRSIATTTTTAPTERLALENLATLLVQSVSDRSAIDAASQNVSACGATLAQDVTTFTRAATSRQTLIDKLYTIPDKTTLPSTLISALTTAWEASEQADRDLLAWARDMEATCTPNDTNDPNYQAATGPDRQATIDKENFVALWNPIAQRYGLAQYQWTQL